MQTYKTYGTCCRQINFEVENDILTKVEFVGGCPGNTQGVSKLAIGQNIDEMIETWKVEVAKLSSKEEFDKKYKHVNIVAIHIT